MSDLTGDEWPDAGIVFSPEDMEGWELGAYGGLGLVNPGLEARRLGFGSAEEA